jgi:PAS domain S-box-containing protein
VGDGLGWDFGVVWEHPSGRSERALRCAAIWMAPGVAAEQLEGLTRQTLLPGDSGLPGAAIQAGATVWQADVGEDRSSLRSRLAAMAGFREALAFPVTGRRGALGAVEFHSRAIPEPDDQLRATLGTFGRQLGHHIEQDRAEEAADESEARGRAIFEAALDCIVVIDSSGRVVQFNPAAERTFGYTAEEAHGREMAELIVPPSLRGRHRRGLRHYLETGDQRVIGRRVQLTAMHADGSEFPVELAIARVDKGGQPLFAGYLRDVSDQLEAQRQLARMAEEQAALRRVATLVAEGTAPEEIFALVNEEVCRLLSAETANLIRYDEGDFLTVLAGYSEPGIRSVPIGRQLAIDGHTMTYRVRATHSSVRIDTYEGIPGTLAAMLRDEIGIKSSVGAPIFVDGGLWGCVTASSVRDEPLPSDAESRISGFTELVGLAVANAETRKQLAESRRRLVEASDDARPRIERNLHDGAQQRLVTLALDLRLAQRKIGSDPDEASVLMEAASGRLDAALEELRDLARGIHPAVLTDHGLGPAIEALCGRCPIPAELVAVPEERLADHVEAAAYFLVAEALTNAAKHALAGAITVRVTCEGGRVLVEVSDDGVGGAGGGDGSGLRGLADRVEALGGRLEIISPVGEGTVVRAELPL